MALRFTRNYNDVIVVCTGNVCRSPYVAARLQQALPGLRVSSAGTRALVGEVPDEHIEALLERHGITGNATPARQLHRRMVASSRLVLTAEGVHRVEAERLGRRSGTDVFTLREFARLLGQDSAGLGLDASVGRVRNRLAQDADRDHDDDLIDPFRRPAEVYDRMAADADAALAVVIPALRATIAA